MLINKISQIKTFCSHFKKVYFHINKVCSHTQERICLKDLQKPTANSYGKFLRQIPTAKSYGKLSRQIPGANSRICNVEDGDD